MPTLHNCRAPGCPRAASKSGFCPTHYQRAAKAKKPKAVTPHKRLTDDQRAEIRRRAARWHTPERIAREMGLGLDSVHRVIRGRR